MNQTSTLWVASALKRMTLASLFFGVVSLAQASTVTSMAAGGTWGTATTWVVAKTGTIKVTKNSTSVTGTGTLFTTELAVNSVIVQTDGTVIGTVASITNDVALTLVAGAPTSLNNISYGAQGVPTSSDAVVITAGSTVTLGAAGQAASITINGTTTTGVTTTLAVGTNTLTVTGAIAFGSTVAGSTTNLTVSTGTINAGSISFTDVQGKFTFSGAGTLNVTSGDFGSGGTFTASTSTVNFTGTGNQNIGGYTYNILTTNGGGTKTLSGAATISGNLNIGASTTFAGGGNTYSVGGTTTVNGTLNITTTAAKTFTGDVTIGTGGNWNETAAAPITFGGSLANNGTFTASTGVHTFSGTGKTFSGANPIVIPSVTINGTYTNNGTLTINTALALGTSGSLTQGTNAILNLGGTIPTTNLTASATGNTVNFTGGGAQTIPAMSYYNLGSSGGGARTLASSGTINIAGTFTPGTNAYTTTGSTVNFNGTTTQTIPAFNYNNLTISNTNPVTLASSGTIGIAGTFTPNAATNTITGSTVNFNGAAQTIPTFTYNNLSTSGSGTKTLSGAATVNSDLTIGGSTTLDVSATPYALTVNGNWTNNGTFTPRTGTVTLSGTTLQTISGNATAFNNLTISNATTPVSVATAVDITVANTMTVSAGSVFSPGAGNTVGGTGTLTGTGTVEVTRIATTPDFLTQYTITNKTLSGLTVDYAGAGAQTIDVLSYNNLKTSGSGTKTAAGNLTIAGDLFVATGSTLDLSTFTANRTTPGGTLTVENNAELAIGGTNTFPASYATITLGTGTASIAPSTVRYNGTTQTVKALSYGDLTLQNGDKTMPATAMTISRDFNVNTSGFVVTGGGNITIGRFFKIFSGTFNAGTFTYNVGDDFSNSGTFTAGTSTVVLNGTGAQSITGGNATTFYNLTINNTKATGAGVTLLKPTTIATNGTLTLTTGVVTSDATNLLILSGNSNVVRTTPTDINTAYVNGPIQKLGNDPIIFPVGKVGAGYHPIGISARLGGEAFTAEYIRSSATALGSKTALGLEAVSDCEYWTLSRATGGTSTPDVTLYWNANSPCNSTLYIGQPSSLVVAHFGTSWDSYANDGGTTGDATAGSVTWKTVSTFSPFTIGTTNGNLNPLPVTFASFTGRKTDGGTQLTWTVAGESNVKGYEVERRTGNGQFTSIGFVAATGNSTYTFTDASQQKGVVFYRLKNVDQSGQVSYSTVLSFRNGTGISVFPTLITNQATILHDAAASTARISLSTADGKQVKLQRPQPGATQTVVDMTGLQAGMYLLKWSDGTGYTETVKLIKQ